MTGKVTNFNDSKLPPNNGSLNLSSNHRQLVINKNDKVYLRGSHKGAGKSSTVTVKGQTFTIRTVDRDAVKRAASTALRARLSRRRAQSE